MKNQKGITLMILVMTLAIMSIILGTITYSSSNSFKLRNYYNMCADIELLDEKIAIYYLEHKDEENSLPITNEMIKINDLITGYSENNVNYNPNNSGDLYKIDLSKLENITLNFDGDDVYYLIDKKSHTIYISNGVILDGENYYTVPIEYEKIQ